MEYGTLGVVEEFDPGLCRPTSAVETRLARLGSCHYAWEHFRTAHVLLSKRRFNPTDIPGLHLGFIEIRVQFEEYLRTSDCSRSAAGKRRIRLPHQRTPPFPTFRGLRLRGESSPYRTTDSVGTAAAYSLLLH